MTIEAGAYNVSHGIHRGRNHVIVTHTRSGRQWASKDPVGLDHNLEFTAEMIQLRYTQFHLDGVDRRSGRPQPSCDTRFWMEL